MYTPDMHIHLDIVGGIAGDMFLAAMLDTFPEYKGEIVPLLETAGFKDLVRLEVEAVNDGIISGSSVSVVPAADAEGHHHRHFSEIRTIIEGSDLEETTKKAAIDIFALLAEAEGKVHGVSPEDVAFHEVGAWDSIADIICAAWLITRVNANSWSTSCLPLGSGQVKTAHGMLPIPAPATSLLLEGFDCKDDGIEGERITPTGAAILKYLSPSQGAAARLGRVTRNGYGLGKKQFPGISNMLKCMVLENSSEHTTIGTEDVVMQLNFEIDDQTAEDLAVALDILRDQTGVLDVTQTVVYGKKGRMMSSVQVLADPGIEKSLMENCFKETTTLGIRQQLVKRHILERESTTISQDGQDYPVKIAQRPFHQSAKAEMDVLAETTDGHLQRQSMRQKVEDAALTGSREADKEGNAR